MERPKCFGHVLPASVSLTAAAQLGGEKGFNRDQLRQAIREPLEVDSLYGRILEKPPLSSAMGRSIYGNM